MIVDRIYLDKNFKGDIPGNEEDKVEIVDRDNFKKYLVCLTEYFIEK